MLIWINALSCGLSSLILKENSETCRFLFILFYFVCFLFFVVFFVFVFSLFFCLFICFVLFFFQEKANLIFWNAVKNKWSFF